MLIHSQNLNLSNFRSVKNDGKSYYEIEKIGKSEQSTLVINNKNIKEYSVEFIKDPRAEYWVCLAALKKKYCVLQETEIFSPWQIQISANTLFHNLIAGWTNRNTNYPTNYHPYKNRKNSTIGHHSHYENLLVAGHNQGFLNNTTGKKWNTVDGKVHLKRDKNNLKWIWNDECDEDTISVKSADYKLVSDNLMPLIRLFYKGTTILMKNIS